MPIRQDGNPDPVTPALMTAFGRTVSPERWKTYQRAAGFDDNLAHRLYLWNAVVGQSFHFPLQTVEVALRNVVHLALSAVYGADWCTNKACLAAIQPRQVDELGKAIRRHWSIYKAAPSTAHIVASLSLGFWTAILRRPYDKLIWGSQLTTAFPNLAGQETLADVSAKATAIQDLRNRIFHQEPLIGHNLSQDYGDVIKLLGWICRDTRDWMRRYSSVPKVLREKPR